MLLCLAGIWLLLLSCKSSSAHFHILSLSLFAILFIEVTLSTREQTTTTVESINFICDEYIYPLRLNRELLYELFESCSPWKLGLNEKWPHWTVFCLPFNTFHSVCSLFYSISCVCGSLFFFVPLILNFSLFHTLKLFPFICYLYFVLFISILVVFNCEGGTLVPAIKQQLKSDIIIAPGKWFCFGRFTFRTQSRWSTTAITWNRRNMRWISSGGGH